MSARTAARATTPGDLDVERLADALARFTRTARRELALPIGASSIAALGTVADLGPMRLGDLARHEGVTPATLSRIVAALEENGYAGRTVDVDDRRSSWLAITPAGRRMLAGVRRDRAEIVAARAERLTVDQRASLAAALESFEALAAD
jgi:DNA-binding MarR family transcriptional regulator